MKKIFNRIKSWFKDTFHRIKRYFQLKKAKRDSKKYWEEHEKVLQELKDDVESFENWIDWPYKGRMLSDWEKTWDDCMENRKKLQDTFKEIEKEVGL